MSHPQDLSLREQVEAVASGALDAGELLQATFERIEERDGPLNSVVVRFPDEARAMLADAPPGPLHGVPVVVKDMFQLPWYAPRDGAPGEAAPRGESAVYRRLRDAGAVIVGIGQCHYWGAGSTGHVSDGAPAAIRGTRRTAPADRRADQPRRSARAWWLPRSGPMVAEACASPPPTAV